MCIRDRLVEKGERVIRDKRLSAIPTADLIGDDDPGVASELHWRISVVLMIPVIALLAVPLSRVNPRQGRFTRLVPAVILCFLYVIILSAARSGIEKGDLPVEWGMWWIHGIFLLIVWLAWHLEKIGELIRNLFPVSPT